jgi:hypothetical protein
MLRKLSLSVSLLFSIAASSFAQSEQHSTNMSSAPGKITIDGNLNDWGDSLRYYNPEKKLNYTLANDQQNLYLAIRFNDRTEQERIMRAGLTWSVNPKGKKKDAYSLTFPVAEQNGVQIPALPKPEGDDTPEQHERMNRDEMRKARLTQLRNMKVTGFKDIDYDIITTTNSYGFKAALNFDEEGNLIYEAAIPLKFFEADDIAKNEWAFNIKVNGISRPSGSNSGGRDFGGMGGGGGRMGGGMGRGGMGGGMGMAGGGRGGMGRGGMRGGNSGGDFDRSALNKSEDFWEKFYLSKAQ